MKKGKRLEKRKRENNLWKIVSVFVVLLMLVWIGVVFFEDEDSYYIQENRFDAGLASVSGGLDFETHAEEINLTQTEDIEDIVLNNGIGYYNDFIDLNDYFEELGNPGEVSLSYSYSESGVLSIDHSAGDYRLDFNAIDEFDEIDVSIKLSYSGLEDVESNEFSVSMEFDCTDSDENEDYDSGLNPFEKGIVVEGSNTETDYCYDSDSVWEYYCNNSGKIDGAIINCDSDEVCDDGECVQESSDGPEFDEDCSDISWYMDNSYTLDLEDCFSDDEDDSDDLDYRYRDVDSDYLSIKIKSNKLTLTPDNNWYGEGYFYVYAEDKDGNEERGNVYFIVKKKSSTTTTVSETLEILNPNPKGSTMNLFSENGQVFSVDNEDYDSIKWYLDDILVAKDKNSYTLSQNLDPGIYRLEVELRKESQVATNLWEITIEKGEEEVVSPIFDTVSVIFFAIVAVLIIIIMLIVWLFISEKNSRVKGAQGPEFVPLNVQSKRYNGSNDFNIPR